MPSRMGFMRVLVMVALVVSLAMLVVGIGRFTWWKPGDYIEISSRVDKQPVVVTGLNVLESTGESLTITATGDAAQPVFLAVALTSDALAFAGKSDYTLLSDFAAKQSFVQQKIALNKAPASKAKANSATSEQPGAAAEQKAPAGSQALATPAQNDAADLKTLDIWKETATGKGEATLKWALSDARWSAVAFTDGKAPAPQLSLRWKQDPSLVSAWLLTVAGALLSAALLLYLILWQISEKRSETTRQVQRDKARAREIAAAATGTPRETASPRPRRRELRQRADSNSAEFTVSPQGVATQPPGATGQIEVVPPLSEESPQTQSDATATPDTPLPRRIQRRHNPPGRWGERSRRETHIEEEK